METPIPIIDIFAGPGGLGEGFSALKIKGKQLGFKIKLSIEKDRYAHQTLELRAFYRQFIEKPVPPEYYEYLKGEISRKDLFKKYKIEALQAKKEAWKATLGRTSAEIVNARIRDALNGAATWVLIGGPPCQAYSLVGRSRIRGGSKRKYREDRRHLLYKQYLQILADHQPPVFVMENVKGLLSSRRIRKESTFDLIISDLKRPLGRKRGNTEESLSYHLFSFSKNNGSDELEPKDFVIRSEEYGIPQARHRIIIFGIRSDIYKKSPGILKNTACVSIEDVIDDLPKLRSGISKNTDSAEEWHNTIKGIAEEKWLNTLETELRSAIVQALEKFGMRTSRGGVYIKVKTSPQKYKRWYIDRQLNGVCNHESRPHISEDLYRYFYSAVFASVNGRSPKLRDFPKQLLPKHKNVEDALNGSIFNDRFRVQVRGKPSTTVVSHISKDGHYYIHYDPLQCRSLTVREAARLQTFPDNYFFEGNRTQQYHQVGNAVPPMLAHKIAAIVFKLLSDSNL
jgi:DNA (cytosine-5)-methyltransferase 1